jgi:hypothetical protein
MEVDRMKYIAIGSGLKYIALGTGFGGMPVTDGGNTPEECLSNFVRNWGHDPNYIFTITELNKAKSRITEAIRELKKKGLI